MTRHTLVFIAAVIIGLAGSLSASDYQGGTQSPLRFGVGARELALGGASLVTCDNATAPFWNPARLAETEMASFSGFHATLFESEVAYQYAGFAYPTLDFGTIAIGIQRLGVNDIEQRDADNVLSGHFSDSRLGVHIGYGRSWSGYRIGVAVSVEHHTLDTYSSTSSPGINLAIARSFGSITNWLRDIDVVMTAENVLGASSQLNQESTLQPVAFSLASSMSLFPAVSTPHHFELSSRFYKVDQIDIKMAFGLEYSYGDFLAVRTGLRDGNWSAGAGVSLKWFGFDYAVVQRDLGVVHMFAVSTTFGKSISVRRSERASRRESEFEHRMQAQFEERNHLAVDDLLAAGQASLESGDLPQAVSQLDKALFIARNSDLDTTQVAALLNDASSRLDEIQRMVAFSSHLDSATALALDNDLFAARYHCNLALEIFPESSEAQALGRDISEQLQLNDARTELLKDQIREIDSLIAYGQFSEAVGRASSLVEMSPDNDVVSQLFRRAQFEELRHLGEEALRAGDSKMTSDFVGRADALYPNHQWCTSMHERLDGLRRQQQPDPRPVPEATIAPLSEAARKQVDQLYRSGQKAFEGGALEDAIADWERVEAIAPDHRSVRSYLVQAYKYLGVEYYGNNELVEAVAIWQRAARLVPDNEEIASYIRRTEAEIAKLRELSYEQ